EGAAYAEHVIVLCEGDGRLESDLRKEMKVRCVRLEESHDPIGERFDDSAVRVFEEVQRLFKERHKERVLVQVVVPSERLQLFEALSGLLKTAQLEHPGFIGQLIGMNGEEEGPSMVKKLEENAGCPMDDRIRYRDGKRWVMDWEEVQETGKEGHMPWKERGVYWITGGLGGLG
ncbi:hypothetical protein, partial [Paenibacillus sp. GbtcB18]|uniref:hypothetical protein n=1 Tax=Paenibacillus sp. GbtcB18 TaxID=2824763 RepID=UPI001C310FB6